jgi:tetratricopeptide (TPR) repeat protein
MLGYQHLRDCDMDIAWESGRRALAEAQDLDESSMTGAPLGLLATLSWIQGKRDDLERYARDMVHLSDDSDESWWRRHGEHSLALRDLLEGHPDHALARLEPLLVSAKLDIQEQALFLPAFAEAYLEAGNLHQAQHVLDRLLALQGPAMRGMLPDALRVHAKLLLAGGDATEAEAVLNDLLDLTRSMPYPFAEAQALAEYSRLEAKRDRPLAARERLEEAITIYRRLGAQPFVDQTQRALAQLAPEPTSKT